MLKEDLCHLVSLLIVLWVIIVGDKTKYCYCPGFVFFFNIDSVNVAYSYLSGSIKD